MYNVINILVYGQMFFFMWLFNSNIKLTKAYERYFYILSFYSIVIIGCFKISFGRYVTLLLMAYVFFVIYVTYILSNKYTFRMALSLGFLIPFLNSYYWESILHFGFITFRGLDLNQFIQLFHLIPIIFLVRKFEFNKEDTINSLTKGLIISFVFHYFIIWAIVNENVFPHNHILKRILHMILRFICLNIVIKIVYNAKYIGD